MSDSEAAVNSGKGVGIQRAGEDGGGQGMGVAREDTRGTIMYSVDSVPPIHLTILFGFQQALMLVGGTISLPFILASLFCPENENQVRSQLLSITMFMCGIATILQCLIGVRLPIIQGGSHSFVAPIMVMMSLEQFRCPASSDVLSGTNNTDISWEVRIREVQGNLILASVTQVLLGSLGLIGVILRFVGPLTIAPVISLIGLSLSKVVSDFCDKQWGISLLTLALLLLFSNVINKVQVPVPAFSIKKKCHMTKLPIFQLFPVVLTIAIVWSFSFILTETGVFPSNSTEPAFSARTDSKVSILYEAPWFMFPLPLPFGIPTYSVAGYMGMMAATFSSIFESVGDYFVAARLSEVPNPPAHAINRGIAIEGLSSIISGLMGPGHATTSYSNNIGIIGITKIASRMVFVTAGAILVLCGVVGKVGAALAMIPDPIVGGTLLLGLAMVVSVGISVLQFCEMFSTRNITILGLAFLMGIMIPEWLVENEDKVKTGSEDVDQVIKVLFGTAPFTGGFIGFFLDNIIPGTEYERGIKRWIETEDPSMMKNETLDVYSFPPLKKCLDRLACCRYFPLSPTFTSPRSPCWTDKYEMNTENSTEINLKDVKNV
ncbi:solute carrier family 23 member 2-like [Ostrea edulis]|uniref:solute carrier family 23 member 2-like n=1 Tax=Ostrea edulis TaxID=37623 RepID=UPI0024AFFF15|nr:solute carrier family 23 member 2-like [Ostrea edulis]